MAAAPDPSQAAPAVTASRKLEQVIQNKHKKPSRKLIKKEVILFYNSWPEPASFACDIKLSFHDCVLINGLSHEIYILAETLQRSSKILSPHTREVKVGFLLHIKQN